MVYLPTFTIKINHSCMYIMYHAWILWVGTNSRFQDDLPSFLYRRTPIASAAASSDDFVLNKETCQHGKFLLNDPRVGAFAGRKNPHMAIIIPIYIYHTYICILYFLFDHTITSSKGPGFHCHVSLSEDYL